MADERAFRCLRADFPFPPRPFGMGDQEVVYFEAKILAPESSADAETELPESHKPVIYIGFSGEFTDNSNAAPGWRVWAAGYHGDDGIVFENPYLHRSRTDEKFGVGDTVGCGIDYEAEEYFFTCNGRVVGQFAFQPLSP
jgi:hypothetical protein